MAETVGYGKALAAIHGDPLVTPPPGIKENPEGAPLKGYQQVA